MLAVLAAWGCEARTSGNSSAARTEVAPVRIDATDLLVKFECARCHDIPSVAQADEDKHCVGCHQAIHAGTFTSHGREVDREHIARWRGRITSIRWVPSLASVDRLRRSWVRDFLLAPHDIRPALVAEMPRLAITADEATRLAAHLVPDVPDAAAPSSSASRGEQLYRAFACARCHRFTGASVDDAELHRAGAAQVGPLDGAWALAPDLRHARARMTTAAIAAWIAAPRGAMPALGVTLDDARALADLVATTPLAAPPKTPVITRLPILARRVAWPEVEKRVFRATCWHCHAVPDFARGDGGPGNSGGFGFAPRGLDVSSYEGISAGSLDEHGERRSVFAKLADGTPRIVAHLIARHVEHAGGVVEGVRGMPLGLPPVSLADIQLVESWIFQGRPR